MRVHNFSRGKTALQLSLGVFLLAPLALSQATSAPAHLQLDRQKPPPSPQYQPPAEILRAFQAPQSERAGLSLSVAEAIAQAVQNNLGIALSKTSVKVAQSKIRGAIGAFEPAVVASYRHGNTRTPPTSNVDGNLGELFAYETDEWTAGIQKQTSLGTALSLDFTNQRANSSLQSALVPLLYSSQLELRLSQPLLRGFAFDPDIPQADVLRARFDTEQARQTAVATLLQLVRETEQGYWDLFRAFKAYQLQEKAVELAKRQRKLTRLQIESGVRPPIDLLNADGTVAARQLTLVQADNERKRAADQLRYLLNLPPQQWSQPLWPRDALPFKMVTTTFDAAFAQALEHRPEMRQSKLQIRQAAFEQHVAEVNTLPSLNASVSYGLVGRRSQYSGTLQQLSSNDGRTWSAGLNFRWTPFNEQARAELNSRTLDSRSAQTQLEAQKASLRLQIRGALRALSTAERSVRAAGRFRSLAERSLDAEQRRFLNGTSDNFYIAQRQNDVNGAQLAELAALIEHRKAATALRAAMGVLLEERNIVLEVTTGGG